jgi:hypothetical protein
MNNSAVKSPVPAPSTAATYHANMCPQCDNMCAFSMHIDTLLYSDLTDAPR